MRQSFRPRRPPERILGAILAGGRSTRFGSDKALALVDGVPLLQRAADALAPQVEALVVCGRAWPGLATVDDRPAPGLGPLGGLAAALHEAARRGFDAVISVPVDMLRLPADLADQLAGGDATVFSGQHLVGYWPVGLGPMLDRYLAHAPSLAVRGWLAHCGARRANAAIDFGNINTPDSLGPSRAPPHGSA